MIQQQQLLASQEMQMEVHQQATTYDMGALESVYKPFISNPFAIIGFALAIIVADAIVFAIIFVLGYILYLLVIVPFVAIGYAIYMLMHSNLRVYVFDKGLIRAKGRKIDVIRWDQVEAVWEVVRRKSASGRIASSLYTQSRVKQTYAIQRSDGVSFKFDNTLHNVVNLGRTIMEESKQAIMPRLIAAYNASSTVTFGPLSISQQGISKGKTMLPWSQVKKVSLGQGIAQVITRPDDRLWFSARVSQIPNPLALTELARYAMQEQSA